MASASNSFWGGFLFFFLFSVASFKVNIHQVLSYYRIYKTCGLVQVSGMAKLHCLIKRQTKVKHSSAQLLIFSQQFICLNYLRSWWVKFLNQDRVQPSQNKCTLYTKQPDPNIQDGTSNISHGQWFWHSRPC